MNKDLPYTFNTSLLSVGDILCEGAVKWNPFSGGIKDLTNSEWNHVAIIKWKNGEWFVDEAHCTKGFIETPLNDYIKLMNNREVDLCVVRVKKPDAMSNDAYYSWVNKAVKKSDSWLGKKYDIGSIIGFIGICIIKKVGRNANIKNNWFNSKDKIFCSEAVCMAYHNPGFNESVFIGENDKTATCATISPKDIRKSKNVEFITGESTKL